MQSAAEAGGPTVASVVVIGAGPSGLACADALALALAPRTGGGGGGGGVLVLEASARVGGRTRSVALASAPGARVDLGGQWLGARQEVLRGVAAELGVRTHAQHCAGRRVLDLGRVVSTYAGLIPSASAAVLVDAQLTLWLLALLQLLLRACGGGSALASALDGVSVEALAARCMWTRGGRALVTIVVQGLFGREPSELSTLALCRYAAASGGLEEMSDSGPGTLQESSFVGGAQQISERLAERAQSRGARLLLGHAVVALELVAAVGSDGARGEAASAGGGGGGGSGRVLVTCANGARILCDRVVVAVPPPIAGGIAYLPALSPARRALMREATMGGIIKVIAVYATPFWREQGFSGEVICDTAADPAGLPVFNVFDGCVPRDGSDATTQPPPLVPILTCFMNGARAREFSLRAPAERRAAVLAQLARYFGEAALAPVEYLEHDWCADPFTRGCPIASYGRAVLSGFGVARALHEREPTWGDRLLWASTETAETSTGFIDGALRAGLRAAGEAAAAAAVSAPTPATAAAASRGAPAARVGAPSPLQLPLLALGALLLLLLSPAAALLVGGGVLPHGDFSLMPSLLEPGPNRTLAQALHDAAVGPATAALLAARPDIVLLIAPHAIALTTEFAVYESSAIAGAALVGGDLHNASAPLYPFYAAAEGSPAFATALAANLSARGANVSGLLAFGDSVPAPLQWSEVIPLNLLAAALNGSAAPGRPSVVVWTQPQRRLICASCMVPELLALGAALAAFADARAERFYVLVSADLSHVHPADINPYPANASAAEAFDAAIGAWAAGFPRARSRLVVDAAAIADSALSCGFTGLVLLEGALGAAATPFASRLLAGPSAPTYYGMAVAVFEEV